MNNELNIHKFDVYSETESSPTADNIFNRVEKLRILYPYDPEYPHYFRQKVINTLEDSQIKDFLNFQLEKCPILGKLSYKEYCRTIIEEEPYKNFLLSHPLKYWLIKEWIGNEHNRESISINSYDNRIKGLLSNEEIEAYFMQLSTKQGNQGPALTKEEVDHLLKANFAGFEPRVEIKKFNTPNTSQSYIRKFVYKFYKLHSPIKRIEDYVRLLLQNFSVFDNTEFDSEMTNFNK